MKVYERFWEEMKVNESIWKYLEVSESVSMWEYVGYEVRYYITGVLYLLFTIRQTAYCSFATMCYNHYKF